MCGITGVMKFREGARVEPATLRQMCSAMVHRGPDDEGVYTDGAVGIGMRGLSIVHLATGHQPLSNGGGTVWIVFNGELYHYALLRPDLGAKRPRYRTHSGTETTIQLYEQCGG